MRKLEIPTVFILLLAAYLATGYILLFNVGYMSPEVEIRSGIARDLLQGNERGREGLVCSVWWPPLPTLLQLPLGVAPSLVNSGAACIIISAVGAAMACIFLLKTLIHLRVSRTVSYAIFLFIAFNPWMLLQASSGSSQALLLGILAPILWCFVIWYHDNRLSGLVGLGILASLLPLINHQAILFTVFVTAAATLACIRKSGSSARKVEGTSLLVFFPTVYTLGLWFLFNWLIMGDFLYFLRGIYVHPMHPEVTRELGVAPFFGPFFLLPFLPLAAAFLFFTFMWRRGALSLMFLAILSLIPFCYTLTMPSNQPFGVARDLAFVVIVCGFLADYLVHRLPSRKWLTTGIASVCLPAVLIFGTTASYKSINTHAAGIPLQYSETYPFVALKSPSNEEIEIKKFILEQELDSRIAIVGFHGYNFIRRAEGGEEFVHSINLRLSRILTRIRGKELCFLVPKPVGLAAFDDINIQRPDLYNEGEPVLLNPDPPADFLIWRDDFPNWRIYTVIYLDRDETILGKIRESKGPELGS